jgi:hypothetical protein
MKLLKEVILDENCERMSKSIVTGYLGELITLNKLEEEEFKPEHFGKQFGFDIRIGNFKIDVKTSTLKDDGFECDSWGWALSREKGGEEKEIKYDAAVCVALDENLNNAGFYCISSDNISKQNDNEPNFDSKNSRFTNVLKRYQKFPFPPPSTSKQKVIDAYNVSEQLIKDGKVIKIEPNGNLGETIFEKL